MTVHTLSSGNGKSTLLLNVDLNRVSLTLTYGDAPINEAYIHGLSDLEIKKSTSGAFFALSGESSLSIRSNDVLFDIILRNPFAPCVELQVPLAPYSWFGLGHLMCQRWPLETASLDLGPFYPFDNGPNGVCTLLDPTLISTAGTILIVDDTSRCLHLGLNAEKITDENATSMSRNWGVGVANFDRMNLPRSSTSVKGNGSICIQSRSNYDWPYVGHPWRVDARPDRPGVPELRFQIGGASDVRTASDHVLSKLQAAQTSPKTAPPEKMMRDPIWTTWVRYGDAINQEQTLAYGKEIVDHGFPRSILEIDDRWSLKYGDLEFDHVKFPDPKAMVSQLHDMGFLVTLWVIPFANLDSKAVTDEKTRHYFVHNYRDGLLGDFDWWQPTRVAALDLTNNEACDWFLNGLQRLRTKYGIDGFKFDAGEPSFLPKNATVSQTMTAPSEYTRLWIQRIASKFALSEVRSGVQGVQELTPMSRLFDRFSTWTLENGLASVLTGTLTSGILGYPFVLPDMIGGNAYGDDKPDAELMIRWTQLNSALPAMQFSIAPWDFGEECRRLCENALQWREELFWSRVKDGIPAACSQYAPFIRPMWWVDQRAEMAGIYDQFMLGDDILVAPVIEKGATERTVVLPPGSWQRIQLAGVTAQHATDCIQGGVKVRATAALDDMPVFLRISND